MADYIGIIGLFLILVGWILEILEVIRKKKTQVPLSFALLYGAGSALLTWHSIELADIVFIVLNAFATLIAIMNIAFNLMQKGKKQAN